MFMQTKNVIKIENFPEYSNNYEKINETNNTFLTNVN